MATLQISFRGEMRGTVTSNGDQVTIEGDKDGIGELIEHYSQDGKYKGDELLNQLARHVRSPQWWFASFVDDAQVPAP